MPDNRDAHLTKIRDHLQAAQDSARAIDAEALAYLIGEALDELADIERGAVN